MPELPDVALYLEALEARVQGHALLGIRLRSVFLLRTAEPPLSWVGGRPLERLGRIGKRLVLELGQGPNGPPRLFLALHLMIAGRLHWKERGAPLPRKNDLAALDFGPGTLVLTEAGSKKRAALHLFADEAALRTLDRGGLEPLAIDLATFAERLRSSRHTLKRALCDPALFAGIGNAYSDEILHRARLSPLQRPANLDDTELASLHAAVRAVLTEWIERLRREAAGEFPKKVTAFRPGMAVHGRFGQPCPACQSPVQRILRADSEINYCAKCQTGGRLLKDRVLSQLLKDDWPASLEELEEG